jgi:hypothetical protein
MDTDQIIRAEALKAAAAYSVHLTRLGEDRLFRMADTFAAYIKGNAPETKEEKYKAALTLIAAYKGKTMLSLSRGEDGDKGYQIGANEAFNQAAEIAEEALRS